MKDIINPINPLTIKKELKKKYFIKKTRRLENEMYIFDYQSAPNTMKEIGRLRELTFRNSGGGTGQTLDIDNFDIHPNQYKQLIIWNPENNAIVGGYRLEHLLIKRKLNVHNLLRQLCTISLMIFY